MKTKIQAYTFGKFVIVIFLIYTWHLFTKNKDNSFDRLSFPSLSLMITTIGNRYEELIEYSLITWGRVIFGLLLGGGLGVLCGVLMSYNKIFNTIADPVIEIVRPIPPVALTPFFILWFGLGNTSQLLLISLGCFMILSVSTYSSLQNVAPIYIKTAKGLGAKNWYLYKTIHLPAITPSLLASVRVALASSFALTVAAEYLGAQGGVGYMIRNARTILQTDVILLGAIILGIESSVTDFLIRIGFRYLTKWAPRLNNNDQ